MAPLAGICLLFSFLLLAVQPQPSAQKQYAEDDSQQLDAAVPSQFSRSSRSLANGRWQLRPGKRSLANTNGYHHFDPEGLAKEKRMMLGYLLYPRLSNWSR